MRTICCLLAMALLLCGCLANPYRTSYTGTRPDRLPQGEEPRLLPDAEAPQLLLSEDLKTDSLQLLEKGWAPMGRSQIRGGRVPERYALALARELGAEMVLLRQALLGTGTTSVPVTDWVPDRRILVSERSQSQDLDTGKVQDITSERVTTIEGEARTTFITQAVETYDQSALFWRRAAPPSLGLMGSGLEDAERRALQSNKGMSVRVVVRNSPAFAADILPGDIVRTLDGLEVLGPEDFFERLPGLSGRKVELVLWRSGKEIRKKVQLR